MDQVLIDMKEMLEDTEVDLIKFINGTASAGARVRKRMQEIKKMAQELRIMVQGEKNKRSGKKVIKKKTIKKNKKK